MTLATQAIQDVDFEIYGRRYRPPGKPPIVVICIDGCAVNSTNTGWKPMPQKKRQSIAALAFEFKN